MIDVELKADHTNDDPAEIARRRAGKLRRRDQGVFIYHGAAAELPGRLAGFGRYRLGEPDPETGRAPVLLDMGGGAGPDAAGAVTLDTGCVAWEACGYTVLGGS
jgi:hypothetical protein